MVLDIVLGFPLSHSYTSILVVTNHFSKMLHLILLTKETDTWSTERWFYGEIVHLHGLPSSIISDHNPRWMSQFWMDLLHLIGVELKRSAVYYSQMNRQSVWYKKTIYKMLRVYALQGPTDWVEHLPAIELHYNATVSCNTGKMLFEVIYGREA